MPTVLIIAGPNGAGKTTFATQWFARQPDVWLFLNADEISKEPGLERRPRTERDLAAGRLLLQRLDDAIESRRDVALETTLASGLYARRAVGWRAHGYRIELIYLRLPDVAASIARVAHRVARGGHNIAEADLRRRFDRSVHNLGAVYQPIVDAWQVWEDGPNGRIIVDRSTP